ncbi:hypothetical protein [Pseudomonas ovata]|uniref:hypothetical protein n=1 Tax=Pseudomonas ovata TaxID=1839709 RepID=UPI001F4DE5C9|nr:hypothetical protein [Pseudomonas ovata]
MSTDTQVTVNITGSSNAGDARAKATSTLQAVYTLSTATNSGSGSNEVATTLSTALSFNGSLNYSGGSLSIVSGSNLAYIAVAGVLKITSGARASVSGCAKEGIDLSGGGIADNAILRTEGTFKMGSSSPPNNLTVGAKTVEISQGGGSYASIKAGAFTANVLSGGSKIGTALIGGVLNTDTAKTITPVAEGTALITLTDGTVYTLDLTKVTVSNNVITTTATGAAKRISGTGTLPATISTTFSAVYGGDVKFSTATVTTFWANNITFDGWSATYSLLKAHGNVSILTANIGQFQGGGNLSVTQWNTPTFSSASRISGVLLNNSGGVYTGNAINNLTFGVPNASPGLPGVPYCDVTISPVNVTSLQDQANYVFYFNGTTPMLRIQNVKKANGTAVPPGPYNLKTTDMRTLDALPFMACNYGNNSCGASATPTTGWVLTGINAFPRGILWFEGNMSFDGSPLARLTNTVLSTGNVTLTSSGHPPLYAPNFSGASETCGGAFYPGNLCKSTTALATWTDASGALRTGLPIGNIAITADGALSTSGWDIYGNVILGGLVNTSGATTTIRGGLSTGNNGISGTTISAGGIVVDVSAMTSDQGIVGTTPATGTDSGSGSGSGSSSSTTTVSWVRAL